MNRPLHFGIVGLGSISNIHARAIQETKGAKLAGVLSSNASRAGEFASRYGCKTYDQVELFLASPDIDIVVIGTPSSTHADIGIQAAQAGKHVVVEKPIDISLEKADALIQACRSHNVTCSVVSQHRFDDAIVKLKEAVQQGKLGKLYFGACYTKWYRSPEYYSSSNWKGTYQFDGGGVLINQSIHYIDLLRYIMGDVQEVYGNCATLHHQIEVEDLATANLKFQNGALGIIQGSTLTYPGLYASLEIYGEKGSVVIKDDNVEYWNVDGESLTPADAFPGGEVKTGASVPENIPYTSHKKQFENLLQSIRENDQPMVTGEEGRATLELVLAVYESSRTGKPVILAKEDI